MNTHHLLNMTKLQEKEQYSGFYIERVRYIEELQANLYEIRHISSDARIIYIGNNDQENLFSLSFQTIPKKSNGVAHVLEHCVLCGSKKYPVKDPFFSMIRRSLHTYMNALTGADFTCYPAATQNEKDFYNLLDVYLNATFYPNLTELSLAQEGHRFDFEENDDTGSLSLQIKGIVYNEMKGALSNPLSRLSEAISQTLFPDSPYGLNSGGEPSEIPTLTLEELKAFHTEHYTLKNCLFFFYGNIPLERHLDYLHEHLFKSHSFHNKKPIEEIPLQPRFTTPQSKQISYPVDVIDEKNPSSYYAVSWLTTNIANQLDCLSLAILDVILMDTDASLLKKALLDSALCRNVSSSIDLEIKEIPYTITCTGVQKEDKEKIEKLLFSALEKIANEGIPQKLIESAFHQVELERSEIIGDGTPFGLILYFRSALLAHHHLDPMWGLCIHTLLQEMRDLLANDSRYFSKLIEKYFLNNTHRVSILMNPSTLLATEEALQEKEMVKKMNENLSDQEKQQILDLNELLETSQQEEEDLSILPEIAMNDISQEIQHIEIDLHSYTQGLQKIRLFSHSVFTNGISYLDIALALPYIEPEDLWLVRIASTLLTQIGTKELSYTELLEEIQSKTGGIYSSLQIIHSAYNPSLLYPLLHIRGKALQANTQSLFSFCRSILTSQRFEEKKRIRELIEKQYTNMRNGISANSLKYAMLSANAFIDKASAIEEEWYGLSYFKKLEKLVSNYEQEENTFLQETKRVLETILQAQPQIDIVVSGQEETIEEVKGEKLWDFSTASTAESFWNSDSLSIKSYDGKLQVYLIPQQTSCTVMSLPSISYGDRKAPYILLAAHIMDNCILHKRIREQGGAYGAGSSLQNGKGLFYLYSYRDPNIASTIQAFYEAIELVSSGNFNEADLEDAKREIIQKLDSPISPGSKGEVAYNWLISGKSDEMRLSYRKTLLSANCTSVQEAAHFHLKEKQPQAYLVTYTGKELFYNEKEKLLRQNIQCTKHPFL